MTFFWGGGGGNRAFSGENEAFRRSVLVGK